MKSPALPHDIPATYGQGRQKGPKSINFPWLYRPVSVAQNPRGESRRFVTCHGIWATCGKSCLSPEVCGMLSMLHADKRCSYRITRVTCPEARVSALHPCHARALSSPVTAASLTDLRLLPPVCIVRSSTFTDGPVSSFTCQLETVFPPIVVVLNFPDAACSPVIQILMVILDRNIVFVATSSL